MTVNSADPHADQSWALLQVPQDLSSDPAQGREKERMEGRQGSHRERTGVVLELSLRNAGF